MPSRLSSRLPPWTQSAWGDLNSRPPRPERGALPSCATGSCCSVRQVGLEPTTFHL